MLLSLSVIVIVILSSFFPVSKWVELRRGKEGEKKTKNANQCGGINVYYRIESRGLTLGDKRIFEEKQKERREKEEKEETTPLRPTGAAGDGEREREREEEEEEEEERGGTRRQQNNWFKGF